MPGSRYEQIEVIVDLMVRLEPRSVLDVGIGNGLYGLLVRQYVEGAGPFAEGAVRLDGIEIFEGYLTGVQRTVYNDIMVGDAMEILPGLPSGSYDLALALDVVEHLHDPRGDELLGHLRRVARNVIVTSPRGEFPQGELFGNVHETHVSKWPPARLRRASAAVVVPHPFISIALFTDDRRFARYYRRYLRVRRMAMLAPAWLVARMVSVGPLREFALRRARDDDGTDSGGPSPGPLGTSPAP
ncbi:MAG: class I SAM-dependent methyltransferase [Actinomycetota bacterium]|nr:class I SAM-dependent methyltransferase [Actinomycetota bacterium]